MRAATPARIALPRAGAAIATPAHLAFQLAHARARDAVHAPFDPDALLEALRERGLPALKLHSAASDRATYLARPNLGRQLDAASRGVVEAAPRGCDLVFVIADGLSAQAASHALPLVDRSLPVFRDRGWLDRAGGRRHAGPGRYRRRDRGDSRSGAGLRADRRAPGTDLARQSRRLPYLATENRP
jgi:Ethanolamine ammonia-lyase light chain (EutC)